MRNGLRIARNAKGAELIKVVNCKDGRLASNQVIIPAVTKVPENGAGARGKANVKVKSYQKNKA